MAKETALPPTKGGNCTSEPHHVVDYYSKPWSFLSRGGAWATILHCQPCSNIHNQPPSPAHHTPAVHTVPVPYMYVECMQRELLDIRCVFGNPEDFFVKEFFLPPRVSSVRKDLMRVNRRRSHLSELDDHFGEQINQSETKDNSSRRRQRWNQMRRRRSFLD